MASNGLCWCKSDVKCPHGISAKIPSMWDEMEQIIDDVLQQFDRKSIKRFLKRDAEGNSKQAATTDKLKESSLNPTSSLSPDKRSRKESGGGQLMHSKSAIMSQSQPLPQRGAEQQQTRPMTSAGRVDDNSTLPTHMSKSTSAGGQRPAGKAGAASFQRNLMSNTLPQIPNRINSPNKTTRTGTGTGVSAGVSLETPSTDTLPPADARRDGRTTGNSAGLQQIQTIAANNNDPVEVPGETTLSVGLMRIADKLARAVLPWQAVLCPRAVETLFDLRQSLIQTKHLAFIDSMKRKLEEKVMGFLRKKEEEVEIWLENEIRMWQEVMEKDDSDLTDYIKGDLKRISDRAAAQDEAYANREMVLATALDDHERDSTRQQLINFRKICRAAQPIAGSGDGNIPNEENPASQQNAVEVRLLQDAISKAQQQMQKQITTTNRDITRKMEEAHDWLCSLADNAVTASESEGILKQLYAGLDKEKARGVEALHAALNTYKEQHSAILDAIMVFAGRIHQHASDYLQREQLVGRAFTQYLLSIITGEIKSHTVEHKKNSYAWESKAIQDRGTRKEQKLMAEFHTNIGPLDKLTDEFKERMRLQLEHVTLKLQSVLNGRENDVTARKAAIHKKLARHVNKACNARRQRLKDATAVRRDEFELEGKCIVNVENLQSELRSAVDQHWVKEHLKERRIYEAASGRMERLEKSALIIWNKHSHLAFDQKEEYEEWLSMYKRERDMKIAQRRGQINREWDEWRSIFGRQCRKLADGLRDPVKQFLKDSFVYDVDVPIAKNLADLRDYSADFRNHVNGQVGHLQEEVAAYLRAQVKATDAFAEDRKQALLIDWRDNLYMLNSAINRRVGALKDMEADLEETIRMTILQHEVENEVFEQLSCSRMEQFWLEWRNKTFLLSRQLRDEQDDYRISKMVGKAKRRPNRKERALDDLMVIVQEDAHSVGIGGGSPTKTQQPHQHTTPGTADGHHGGAPTVAAIASAEEDHTMIDPSDTMRIKRLLDDIRPEVYREFTHFLTRNLEKVRRDLGEGKRRIVPPYAVCKSLIIACDSFWERAKLAERCVGRISSRGVLLFKDGLPTQCRALFNVSATMFVMQDVPLRETQLYMDCDDVFELMTTSLKQWFLIGLLAISMHIGDFGAYVLRSECMWACSCFGMDPPAELVHNLDAKGLDKSPLLNAAPTGFHSDDPVDLTNSLMQQSTDLIEVKHLQETFERKEEERRAAVAEAIRKHEKEERRKQRKQQREQGAGAVGAEDSEGDASDAEGGKVGTAQGTGGPEASGRAKIEEPSRDSVGEFLKAPGSSVLAGATEESKTGANSHAEVQANSKDDNSAFSYHNELPALFATIQTHIPVKEQVEKLSFLVPSSDITILLSFLGRPEGSMEMTPHRVCQVITFWRRTSIAIISAAFDPPSTEFPRIKEIVTAHNSTVTGRKRMGYGNISCVSPYESVSSGVDWVTSIKGLPISLLMALCLMTRGGSCDPWLEDPKQTGRSKRIIYELNELLEALGSDIPRAMKHDEHMQAALPKNIEAIVQHLDMNLSGSMALEALRSFVQREDSGLTNTQISMLYWSLCRVDEEMEEGSVAQQSSSIKDTYQTFQTGDAYRPIVETEFNGDPEEYMERFATDVSRYLDSMPTIDTNVILGYLPGALVPASAHELVSDAMKLDVSARNAMPSTCCVWVGQRPLQVTDSLSGITIDSPASLLGNKLLGVGPDPFHSRKSHNRFQRNIRTYTEVDLIAKYPELCDILASNKHYGPAGNEPIIPQSEERDHWHELLERRLHRMDKLTVSWRDTMMNEWSTSLYQSRIQRYVKRVEIVKRCIGVYHQQYSHLRESIVQERHGLISEFAGIEAELLTMIQDDYNFFSYHTSFLERALRRFEGQFERVLAIITDIMLEFQRHCGSIKRRGIERVSRASDQLSVDLEEACNGLIMGYTAGYAQAHFDELIYRGKVWRDTLTEAQGRLILEKEKFMTAKDEIDRDLTIHVTDKLTINRSSYKGHLEALADDTAQMLDNVATTRASYASVQKDANARLILRIEKSVRESRKLRVAAEQQAELEGPAMRDIRVVLDTARTSCLSIVAQIKETCLKQLHSLEPQRQPHRDKMEGRVKALSQSWTQLDSALQPVIDDYEREVFKQLRLTNTQCVDVIANYREAELRDLKRKYTIEREELVQAFRKHFREYDLSEAAIFEKFNKEVVDTVEEMQQLWGPSRPQFILQGLAELEKVRDEALTSAYADIANHMYTLTGSTGSKQTNNDDIQLTRMELVDCFGNSLSKIHDYGTHIPVQYIVEKKDQLLYIEEMSMTRNGDMTRPQVKAVLDLLVAGIEIDADFGKGYQSLLDATESKSRDCSSELSDFNNRYSDPLNPVSIGYSANLTRDKVKQRADEVAALIDASNAHMVADHSRLDVLMGAGEKDIEEWANLTLQLVENAFNNAEQSYLSNLWPTPPATPRLELIPEDEDRVGKLKALLNATQAEGVGGRVVPYNAAQGQQRPPVDQEAVVAILGGELEDDDEISEALRLGKKEQRKADRGRKRAEKERLAREEADRIANTQPPKVKPDETRELQDGWFECCTAEGYTYYFNPDSEETLWDLPAALKVPKFPHEDGDDVEKIETPRELLMLEDGNLLPDETVPMRVVPRTHQLDVKLDPTVLMSQLAEEARAAVALAVETALDVTAVIRGKKGHDERTIADLLGDKFNPAALKPLPSARSEENEPALPSALGLRHPGDDGAIGRGDVVPGIATAGAGAEVVDDTSSGVSVNEHGQIITLSDGGQQPVDAEMAAMLRDLGLGGGSDPGTASEPMLTIEDAPAGHTANDLQPSVAMVQATDNQNQWLQLGLGDAPVRGEQEGDSSDGEDYTGYKEERAKRKAESRFQETRELDLMAAEDELSIAYENEVENSNCTAFLNLFGSIVSGNPPTAHRSDKEQLLKLNASIKPLNANDILSSLKTSWRKLDEIIRETAARELAQAEMEERLRTAEGMRRQQTILEHAEDIEEMADFLHDEAGLSKTNAKRVGTECVLRNISTPKKLAKIWNRQHISLAEFKIDEDDMEEVEAALKKLIIAAGPGSTMMMDPNAQSFYSQFAAPATPDQYGSVNQALDSLGYVQEVQDDGVGFSADPDDDSVTKKMAAYPPSSHALPPKGDPTIDLPSLPRHPSRRSFSMNTEGYKSFKGGWIEGLSDEGHIYYYNTATGASSWHLPNAHPEDVHHMVLHEHDIEDVELETPEAKAAAAEAAAQAAAVAAAALAGYADEPTHNFEHTLEDYNQQNYNHDAQYQHDPSYDPNAMALTAYDDSQQHEADGGYYGEQHPDHDQHYEHGAHDPNDPNNYYYDPNDPNNYYHQQDPNDPNNYYHQQDPNDPNNYYDEEPQLQLPYDPNYQSDYPQQTAATETEQSPEHHSSPHYDHAAAAAEEEDDDVLKRSLPVPVKAEVATFSKKEGVARQLTLLNSQDRWQNALVKTQHFITEQKSQYLQMRVEMFEKVSARVDTRLNTFVEDIKFMQKTLKKDLGESVSTERDLRRLFEQNSGQVVQAEKLSFILESLEKFKGVASERYESAFTQIDKFGAEWELIKTELLQIGNIYDDGVSGNLEQCRLACEHNAKLFAYDQLKIAAQVKKNEMRALRNAMHRQLRADTFEEEHRRALLVEEHREYNRERNQHRRQLLHELQGWAATIEDELKEMGFPPIEPENEAVPEEENIMSYMLTQMEMEISLAADYDSIVDATKKMTADLQAGIKEFDETEKKSVMDDGSWFNKHRETLERHEQALHTTLTKVRNRMNEGYQLLNSKLEALDYDVERAAEDELFKGEGSLQSGSLED